MYAQRNSSGALGPLYSVTSKTAWLQEKRFISLYNLLSIRYMFCSDKYWAS
jgi:hypothetical protein